MAKKARKPKKPTVILSTTGKKAKDQVFDLQHALKILRMPNSAWICNDPNYIFEKNDIKRRASKTEDSKSEE